ncbi:retrovirus-related pol polyprotein from transposon TNT 1-94 [Tanacetum coccineum]
MTSLHTAVNMWIRNLVIRNRVGDLQLGIESYQTKINLERPNWDAANYYFKEDYTIVPKPRAVSNEITGPDHMVKDFNLFGTIRAWRLGSGQRMTREEAKTSSQQSRKDYRSEGSIEDTYPILLSFTHCGNKSILRVLRIILVILPEHPSETIVFHNEDGNPARANIKQALGYLKDGDGDGNSQPHKGVKASANSDVMYSFTSAQDGDSLQDDVRLCLGDDLKKAQDHSQRQAWCWYAAGGDGGDVVMVRRWLKGVVDVGVVEMVYRIWWISGRVWRRWRGCAAVVMEVMKVVSVDGDDSGGYGRRRRAALAGETEYGRQMGDGSGFVVTRHNKGLVNKWLGPRIMLGSKFKSGLDFQNSPDNEEDTRSSQEYLNDLKEEYQARVLLAKSKRFFKKGSQRFSGAKATKDTQCHKCGRNGHFARDCKYNKVKPKLALLSPGALTSNSTLVKNKGLIAETYEWDVSSDDNEVIEVKALITFNVEERFSVCKECARNGEWVQISIRKVCTLLELEDNEERKSFLDYLCIDLNYVKEQRNNLLSKHRDLVQTLNTCKEQLLVLKQAKLDYTTMQHASTKILKVNKNLRKELNELKSITKTWLNSFKQVNQCISEQIPSQKKRIIEAEGFILPNHDTGRILPAESQRNTTDPLVAVIESSATDYDSADESSVCSTPLPPLKKLDGAAPVSGQRLSDVSLVWKSVRYGVSNGLDTVFWSFLE